MDTFKGFAPELYTVNEYSFEGIALEVFRFQAIHNPVYSQFLRHLSVNPDHINTIEQIPFLPISFFKNQIVELEQ